MDYEAFYSESQPKEKAINDILATQQKLFKRISKSLEIGDIKSAAKDLAALESMQADCELAITELKNVTDSFDAKEYLASGDFASSLLTCLENAGVDAKGENNVYEVFPYRLKIDSENLDIYLDRKRLQCLRPRALTNIIKSGRDKLLAASFNPLQFANELAGVYDLYIVGDKRNKSRVLDADVKLIDLYAYLTPMKRYERDYDRQSFAFDIARLYSSDTRKIKDGRSFQFGPSRDNNKSLRILDSEGHERFLATVRFYTE